MFCSSGIDWVATGTWVQAFGTVGAIIAAIVLAVRQTGIEDRRNKFALAERLGALLELGRAAERNIEGTRAIIVRTSPVTMPMSKPSMPNISIFDQLDAVLGGIPLHELPSFELVRLFMEFRKLNEEAKKQAEMDWSLLHVGTSVPNPLAAQLEAARKLVGECEREVVRLTARKPRANAVTVVLEP
jgi:hypothetical protein